MIKQSKYLSIKKQHAIFVLSKKCKSNEGGGEEYEVNYKYTDGQHLQIMIVSQKHINSIVVADKIMNGNIIQSGWFQLWCEISLDKVILLAIVLVISTRNTTYFDENSDHT